MTFAEVAAGRQNEVLFGFRSFHAVVGHAPLGCVHAAVEDDEVAREFFQPQAEVLEMSARLGQDYRSASRLQADIELPGSDRANVGCDFAWWVAALPSDTTGYR